MNKDPTPAPAGGSNPSSPSAPVSAIANSDTKPRLASTRQKVSLFSFLLLLTGLLLRGTYVTIYSFNQGALAESEAAWELPPNARLKPGPANFRYDAQVKMLRHRGPLDAREQLQLRDLLEFEGPAREPEAAKPSGASSGTPSADAPAKHRSNEQTGVAPPAKSTTAERPAAPDSAATTAPVVEAAAATAVAQASSGVQNMQRSYHSAIDSLAYASSASQAQQVQLLLLLGLFGGALGAVLRSLVDFVGHACYTGKLDFNRWWPLYFTRPLVGGILGFVLVVLFKAKLLTAGEIQPIDDSFWWLGMAVIGGFSTVDVTLRLRLAAKALFGVESGERKKE